MGYGGKFVERERARELRAKAWTLQEIADELGVAKGSVSVWVRDVEFTPKPRNRGHSGHQPHPLHLKKLAEIEQCRAEAEAEFGELSARATRCVRPWPLRRRGGQDAWRCLDGEHKSTPPSPVHRLVASQLRHRRGSITGAALPPRGSRHRRSHGLLVGGDLDPGASVSDGRTGQSQIRVVGRRSTNVGV